MKSQMRKIASLFLSVLMIVSAFNPAMVSVAAGEAIIITDSNGNEIAEKVEVQEYRSVQLSYTVTPSMPEGAYVVWESNLPLLAGVDDSGKVTAYDYSKAAIIQQWIDENIRSMPIVGESMAKQIENAIASSGIDIETANTDLIVAIVSGIAGEQLGNSLRNALDNMNVEITATLYSADGVKLASDKVDVLVTQSIIGNALLTGVHITNRNKVPTTVAVGKQIQLYATATPVRVAKQKVSGYSWSAEKTKLIGGGDVCATVDSNGLVTFTGVGEVKIVVRPKAASTLDKALEAFSTSMTFTVVSQEDMPLTDFSIGGTTSVTEGETTRLEISNPVPEGAYTGDVIWESSDPTVAIIDGEGNVTGLDGGSGLTYSRKVTITATIGEISRSVEFEVKRGALQGNINDIEIVGEDALGVGESTRYVANVFPSRLNTNNSVIREWGLVNDDNTVTWATDSTPASNAYASIDRDGNFTAIASGVATITAKATYNGNTVQRTKSIFLGKAITDFSISGNLTIDENKTTELTIVNIAPDDYDEEILDTIKWTSSNPKVATVDKNGVVRGIEGGTNITNDRNRTAEITATIGGVSRTVTVNVRRPIQVTDKFTEAYIDGVDTVIKDLPFKYTGSFSPSRVSVADIYWGVTGPDGQEPFDDSNSVKEPRYSENQYARIASDGSVYALEPGETDIYVFGTHKTGIGAASGVTSHAQTSKHINTIEIEPKSISVTAPTRTNYVEGETELDLTGLVVSLTYDRSDVEQYYGDTSELYSDSDLTVEVTDYEVGAINTKILDTEQYIVLTVTRAGKNYRGVFAITLESKDLDSINLIPPKYKYLEGETELDLTGLEVRANYTNAASEMVDGYTVYTEDFDPTLLNVEQQIRVSYSHEGRVATDTFPVKVYGVPVVTVDANGYDGGWSPTNITYTLSATHKLGGITYYYRTEGNDEWFTLSGNTLTVTQDSNDVYYFKAINGEGIESAETEGFVTKKDSVTPYFSLEKSVTAVTNTEFKILIKDLRTGISGIKSITVNGNDITGQTDFTVSENDNYTVTVTANNGLSKTLVKSVNNIDRDAPRILEINLLHKDTYDTARVVNETEFGLFFNDVVELEIIAEDVGIAGIDHVEYRLLDENREAIRSWATYNSRSKPQISPDFKGYVEVKAIDKAGNESVSYYSNGFVIDGNIPTIQITAESKGEQYTAGTWTSDTVTVTVSSYAFSGIFEYLYRIDGGEWVKMDKTSVVVSEEGEHTVEFKTVSYSVLESEITSIDVKIDRQTPVIRVDFQGTFKRWSGENMTFTFSTLEPSLSGITYYYNDGTGWKEITTGDQIVLYDNINTSYQFMAVNGAGTQSQPSDSYIVMIDTVVPTVTAEKEIEELTVAPYKVYLSYIFGEAGLKSVTLNGEDITDEEYITVSKNGTYLITVTGNNQKTSSYLLVIDNFYDPQNPANKPVLQVMVDGAVGIRTGDNVTFNFVCADGQDVTYYYDNGDGWVEIEGNSLTLSESIIADYKFKAVNKYGVESYESPIYSVILDKAEKTGAGLYGTISAEDGIEASYITVKVFDYYTNRLICKKTVSKGNLQYSFDGITEGAYIVIAECDGFARYSAVVIVSGDTEHNIELEALQVNIGDVDLDGDIDYDDYELMLQYIRCGVLLNDAQIANGDVNGDGSVDGVDALYLSLYLKGKVKLP